MVAHVEHIPEPGTVRDRAGNLRTGAQRHHYPLSARCTCGDPSLITCADGTADWCHLPAPTVEIIASELRAGDVLVTRTRSGRELERRIVFTHYDPTRGSVNYQDETTPDPGSTVGAWTIPSSWPLRIRPRA